MIRIPYDATTEEEVIQYFKTRQLQLASAGFSWDRKLYKNKDGYFVHIQESATGKTYDAFYVLSQDRKKGASLRLINQLNEIITINDCHVISFLQKANKNHLVVSGAFDMPEYNLVEEFYGNGMANRSKIWFMNHIDEGMIILNHIKTSESAKAGFCLHPLTQDDDNLAKKFSSLLGGNSKANPYNVGLSLEYRNIANAYLSKREIKSIDEIAISPLKEVNDMLIADKVQNYKDFILYHRGTHPRSEILEHYFNNWLDKLNCRDTFEWFVEFSKQFEREVEVIGV
jgi:hypothetical protein